MSFYPVTVNGFVDVWVVPQKGDEERIRELLQLPTERRLQELRREFVMVGGRNDSMLTWKRKPGPSQVHAKPSQVMI